MSSPPKEGGSMSTASFNGLLIISVIAVMAPVLAAGLRRVKLVRY